MAMCGGDPGYFFWGSLKGSFSRPAVLVAVAVGGLVTVITTVMATPGLVVAVGGAIVPGVLAVGGTAVAQPTNK